MKKIFLFISVLLMFLGSLKGQITLQGLEMGDGVLLLKWESDDVSSLHRKSTALDDADFVNIASDFPAGQCEYLDTITPSCRDTITYIVKTQNQQSNEVSFVLGDTEIPKMPRILAASIDLNTQQYVLSWQVSESDDVLGYVVCKGDPCVALDTIWGAEQTTYICESCDISELNSLALMAFDSCMNTSLRTERLTNMILKANSSDCANTVDLSWNYYANPYINTIPIYGVYMQQNNQGFTLLQETTETSLQINVPPSSGITEFYVAAYNDVNSVRALSNRAEVVQSSADTLAFVIMRAASVCRDNKSVEVRAYVDDSKIVKEFRLYRSKNNGAFNLVQTQACIGNKRIEFVDDIGQDIGQDIYSYYIEASDVCGATYTRSQNIVSTFKIKVEQYSMYENKIISQVPNLWSVGDYTLMFVDSQEAEDRYISTSSSNTLYDNYEKNLPGTSRMVYYVSATESTEGPDGEQETMNSSQNYIEKSTLFFIPNAFAPRDGNEQINTFKPECHFVQGESYLFQVYNRWGQKLFETQDPLQGWDGRFKGEFCQIDTYIYKIQFVNSEGKQEKHAGTFFLYD